MKILAFCLSIIISLVVLEGYTRFIIDDGLHYNIEMMKYAKYLKSISNNPKVGLEHKKNIKKKLMNVEISLNSDGFRNKDDLSNNSKKILMLWDSMTLGWGAQFTFSYHLDNKLKDYEVINGGIGNTNTIMQVNNFFYNFINRYNYDLIILNFFINDFEDIQLKEPNLVQKYSYFYTYVNSMINQILVKYELKYDLKTFYSKSFEDKDTELKTFNEIIKLKKFCDENKIKFIIHNIPELNNLKEYQFINETNLIKEFAHKNDIFFIDSYNVLKDYESKDLWVTLKDPHANDKAHLIIADFLFNEINAFLSN